MVAIFFAFPRSPVAPLAISIELSTEERPAFFPPGRIADALETVSYTHLVTLDQTNNAAEIYSECAGQVQSTFAQGFTASANVAVTLNWHITNPSASISTSSSGSSVSATIAGNANGGEVGLNGAELSWVGEEGLEYIIPVSYTHLGAAAGDTSATWQNYANQIWKNGSDELKASLTDPSNPMYETRCV